MPSGSAAPEPEPAEPAERAVSPARVTRQAAAARHAAPAGRTGGENGAAPACTGRAAGGADPAGTDQPAGGAATAARAPEGGAFAGREGYAGRSAAAYAPRRAGRPRSAAADRAILAATRAALAEQGWGGLSLGDVAARAGVAKTTLYRRWAGKNELVVDAIAALFEEQLDAPDLGSLEADLSGVVLRFAALLDRPETRAALMAVIAEAGHDDALRQRIREAIVDRQKHLVLLGRERAQARGEMPPDDCGPDPVRDDLIFDVVAGAVVHRVMVSSEPVDEPWAHRLAQLLVAGLSGGCARDQRAPGG